MLAIVILSRERYDGHMPTDETSKAKNLKNTIRSSIMDLKIHLKNSEALLGGLKDKISKLDSASTRAAIQQVRDMGESELHRLKGKLHKEMSHITDEFFKTSDRLYKETQKVRGRVKASVAVLSSQIKTLKNTEKKTEKKVTKPRVRRRPKRA